MDLEKFEREELPRIKKEHGKDFIMETGCSHFIDLIIAFESAMVALIEERERCVKIAEDHITDCVKCGDCDFEIAEEIRRWK